MAYKIVNGPTVMSCSADPIVTANFKFIYDDAEASVKEIEVAIDDIIRIKYMGGEYSPVVLEAEGRLDRFSVLKNKNGKVFASDAITDTLGEVKTLVVDTSTEKNTQTISVPVAAIRELEIIRYADGTYPSDGNGNGVKPDCAAPGTNCPLNPDCLCPSYKEPERIPCGCKPPKEEIDFDGDKVVDAYIDDSGLTETQIDAWRAQGYVCVFKGTPYKRLQDAINNVVCPCVDTIQDAIIIFEDIMRPAGCKDINYIVTGPCIIRSLSKGYTRIIEGAFTVNSPEMVILYNLEIHHTGEGKEVVAIDSVNASLSVQRCIIALDDDYRLPEDTTDVQLPMGIRVCRLATSGKGYENVYIKENTFIGYPDIEVGDSRSTAICLARNFGEVYGDFPYIIEGNTAEGKHKPHILFSDQNFNGGVDDSTLECSGLVYTKEGLRDMLKYQGADTYICIKGIIDLDIEQFAISVATESRLVNEGILNLGANIMTNYGRFCNSGIVTGGTIINNGELTVCAGKGEQWVDFYNTKVRTNGAQKVLKAHMLKNEAKK